MDFSAVWTDTSCALGCDGNDRFAFVVDDCVGGRSAKRSTSATRKRKYDTVMTTNRAIRKPSDGISDDARVESLQTSSTATTCQGNVKRQESSRRWNGRNRVESGEPNGSEKDKSLTIIFLAHSCVRKPKPFLS